MEKEGFAIVARCHKCYQQMCGCTATVEEDHRLLKSVIDKHLAFALSLKVIKI